MARDFDGVDDTISCGSDASVDQMNPKTLLLWLVLDADTNDAPFWTKIGTDALGWLFVLLNAPDDLLYYEERFSGTDGAWYTATTVIATGTLYHIALVYDNSDVANVPTFYVNGVAQTTTVITTPTGTVDSDAANSLRMGAYDSGGASRVDGRLGFMEVENAALSVANINRHRWWGCTPGGPSTMNVWHPLWTDSLVNKGTATANGVATGTTMDNATVPRAERMWGSMMGVGR